MPASLRRRFTPRRWGAAKAALTSSEAAQAAAAAIRTRRPFQPRIGLVLGSGLGALGDRVVEPVAIPYSSIPHFPCSGIEGHANELILGHLGGQPVAAMRGRVHLYEGYSAAEVAFPVRVLHALGIEALIVSNAAGGLNPSFQAGDLMLIRDHIFLPGLAGNNPLRGPNDDNLGPRFPDMSAAYDERLRALSRRVAARQRQKLQEGVYAMVAGPSYETPAEHHALRAMGADAVGMSTCPEVVAARHMGLSVLGISLISNVLTGAPVHHDDVLEAAEAAASRFCALVEAVVAAWRD